MGTEYWKEPYEVIAKKLELAELTIHLGSVTREKWSMLETMRDVLSQEEDLLRQIADATAELQKTKEGES